MKKKKHTQKEMKKLENTKARKHECLLKVDSQKSKCTTSYSDKNDSIWIIKFYVH